MKPFYSIAIPHKDIIEKKITMDVFAANLWDVYNNIGPEEYRNAEVFFNKTYMTIGLKRLMNRLEIRLNGGGGDPVIYLHTSFGGGKTHALIAAYHKAIELNAEVFVFVGESVGPQNTIIWEELEKQLTGKVEKLKGKIVPSGDTIINFLKEHQPLVILIDELIEYLIPASGITVGKSSLDSQILSFIKRLSDGIKSLDKCIMIITSPAKEDYPEKEQILLNLLEQRLGRVDKPESIVQDNEIYSVIRKKLFSDIDETEIENLVTEIVNFFADENMLPPGREKSQYKDEFINSYPFLPDVIDCFYQRWGSFPKFQRTRGVLRLLSLIIYSLYNSDLKYISLGDIDLSNSDIREMFIELIGNEYDGIIAADITNSDSGSKQVDSSLGSSYNDLRIGTRCSTSIFLYSFSGGPEKGANLDQVKRSATDPSISSSIISEAIDKLSDKLFYLELGTDRFFFTNQPNLNLILLVKMGNIDENDVKELEKEQLEKLLGHKKLKKSIWPENTIGIEDNANLKLIILKNRNDELINNIIESKGTIPRVYRNTIVFLIPLNSKIRNLENHIRRKIAWEQIGEDDTLKLSYEQRRSIRDDIIKEKSNISQNIRETYRIILIPEKHGLREIELDYPKNETQIKFSDEIIEKLKSEGIIIEDITPIPLRDKYLKDQKYVHIKSIYEIPLKTRGETIIIDKSKLEKSIIDGVKEGAFGLGFLKDDEIQLNFWKCKPEVTFIEEEILIDPLICEESTKRELAPSQQTQDEETPPKSVSIQSDYSQLIPSKQSSKKISRKRKSGKEILNEPTDRTEINLPSFGIPVGKIPDIYRLLLYLETKFKNIEIKIKAINGKITEEDYENKIKEALKQLKIKFD